MDIKKDMIILLIFIVISVMLLLLTLEVDKVKNEKNKLIEQSNILRDQNWIDNNNKMKELEE